MPTNVLTIEQVVDAVNDVLARRRQEVRPVDATTPLRELELDSLDLAELFVLLEEEAGASLDPDTAGDLERVGDLTSVRPL